MGKQSDYHHHHQGACRGHASRGTTKQFVFIHTETLWDCGYWVTAGPRGSWGRPSNGGDAGPSFEGRLEFLESSLPLLLLLCLLLLLLLFLPDLGLKLAGLVDGLNLHGRGVNWKVTTMRVENNVLPEPAHKDMDELNIMG